MLSSLYGVAAEVGGYWQSKAYDWWTSKKPRDALIDRLENADTFEEWEQTALQLDAAFGYDLWRQNATSKHYDYRLIYERQQAIIEAREDDDVLGLVGLLRSGLVRNLGGITAPRLFNRAYAGTKLLIEDYITQVALAIQYVTALLPPPPSSGGAAAAAAAAGLASPAIVQAQHPQEYAGSGWLTAQAKLDLLHDTRQAFGRSTLVLQGGAIFGICHLGVIKALHLRGLLPRIITGTATGALIAALVSTQTEDELLDFLESDNVDFTAFASRTSRHRAGSTTSAASTNSANANTNTNAAKRQLQDNKDDKIEQVKKDSKGITEGQEQEQNEQEEGPQPAWNSPSVLLETLTRRTKRYLKDGYFLDVQVLEDFIEANIGDITFSEAYARTKRVLNITIATSAQSGIPNLLNYLTAPNVLIRSAAVASNASGGTASTGGLFGPVTIKCKDEHGNIVPWSDFPSSTPMAPLYSGGSPIVNPVDSKQPPPPLKTPSGASSEPQDSPLARVASLFNVNHFIVSQARPYILPFISASAASQHSPPHPTFSPSPLIAPVLRLVTGEVHHRLTQLDECGLLPPTVRKLLLDEVVPSGSSITLVPSISAADYLRLLDRPGREEVDYWIKRGERSVWPAVSALRIRCAVEVELDRGYQLVRRRKPLDGDFGGDSNKTRSESR